MPKFDVTLSDQQYNDIVDLVEQGDFLNWDQAAEELLSMGLNAYTTREGAEDISFEEELFADAINDQQDPALRDDSKGDEGAF